MRTLIQPDTFRALPGPIVLAAGFFDGVHVGHRTVLDGAIALARAHLDARAIGKLDAALAG